MPRYIIHVNRQLIAKNAKDGGNRPVYIIRDGRKVRYGREVIIKGPSRMVYSEKRLSCGARAWIETDSDVIVMDEMSYGEAKEMQ